MVLGLLMAVVSGCAVPVWLILLAKSLDQFSNMAYLVNAGADIYGVIQGELNELVVAFAVLGGVSLVSGSMYVSLWTYTGEKQALRIQERFVVSLLHQDAAWLDARNRDELPTAVTHRMIHLRAAMGRHMADWFANLWSSIGCLAVALILNPPLALIMLLVFPVVVVFIAVFAYFIRASSRNASTSFSHAGALATEVLAGIKTIAALCAEPWAARTYDSHLRTAQYASVRGGAWMALSTGVTSLLFYITFTVAFFIGTQQVADNAGKLQFLVCLLGPWLVDSDFDIPPWLSSIIPEGGVYDEAQCRVSGATVMCCIYGVILSATFFGLMAPAQQAINVGRQAAVDIFETIHHRPDMDPRDTSGTKLESLKGDISLDRIFFSYPTRPKDVLYKDFNLTIKAGSTLGICGPSGWCVIL
jgi:ATP-binding cassette subfamily B (MDR/TAP) protein 1